MIQQLEIAFKYLKEKAKKINWHSVLLVSLLIIFFLASYIMFRYLPDYLIKVGRSRKYDIEKTGTTGDTFGGTLGPIVGYE